MLSQSAVRPSQWARTKALYRTILGLTVDDQVSGPVPTVVLDDLGTILQSVVVDESLVNHLAEVCGFLSKSACRSFSERVDAYEVGVGEEAAALRLKLLARGASDGQAPPASELAALEESERSTAHSDAWLALRPTPSDVVTLFGVFRFTGPALGRYSDQLGIDERSTLWIEAAKARLLDALLGAIGRPGVGPEAVEYCRAVIAELSQEPKRREQVRRLRLANLRANRIQALACSGRLRC